ncbi:MAG: glutamyl-tRNA reductase [Syntrophaceticus schinkii]|jgi:glutamyl-tRNA reductase|nr:glutamyl-tRNA reductase [Syntrophaceticus schinkii]MDD4260591.1 glutamyl-tRNA reductase [Syntrophaceticus schinkii]MDD4674195.1 glutamyl-tRNA reductase [Syntrophaceticus schinkii]
MHLIALGMNHRSAPVEVREKLAFSSGMMQSVVTDLKGFPSVGGFIVLSTCNRTEIYASVLRVQDGICDLKRYLCGLAQISEDEVSRYFHVWRCEEVVEHLFRVAAGLDSMILGETEIQGQVIDAYQYACSMKTSDKILNTLFQDAIRFGKRFRSQTAIDQHPVSVSYAAVELARSVFGNLSDCTVLIIGAGEMGELALKHLIARGVKTVLVSNRSYARACNIAQEYGGEAIRYDHFLTRLDKSDIVIGCTAAAHFVIHAEKVRQVMAKGRQRPLFFIDIAVPRDIDPAVKEIPGVILYNIDDLEEVVLEGMQERRKAALEAEGMLQEAVGEFLNWASALTVVPTIRALQQKGNEIMEEELRRCFNRLGETDPRTEKVIKSMAYSIVNKLLHTPTMRLKEYACRGDGQVYGEMLEDFFGVRLE